MGERTLQDRVADWMLACFGAVISADRIERNHRFIEEALELVQACGCSASEAHQLVDYVYGRPQGDVNQEVGGVMVTLAALCLANGFDMHAAGETELARVWTKIDKIRAKQATKPRHSPLPAAPAVPEGLEGLETTEEERTRWLQHGTGGAEITPPWSYIARLIRDFARLAADNERLKGERDDYKQCYESIRENVRLIDVAMHGEAGAAKSPSACDLIQPAEQLRKSLAAQKALVEEAGKLLQPLSDAAYFFDAHTGADVPLNVRDSDNYPLFSAEVPGDPFNHSGADYVGVEITVADTRAARAFLSKLPGKETTP